MNRAKLNLPLFLSSSLDKPNVIRAFEKRKFMNRMLYQSDACKVYFHEVHRICTHFEVDSFKWTNVKYKSHRVLEQHHDNFRYEHVKRVVERDGHSNASSSSMTTYAAGLTSLCDSVEDEFMGDDGKFSREMLAYADKSVATAYGKFQVEAVSVDCADD